MKHKRRKPWKTGKMQQEKMACLEQMIVRVGENWEEERKKNGGKPAIAMALSTYGVLGEKGAHLLLVAKLGDGRSVSWELPYSPEAGVILMAHLRDFENAMEAFTAVRLVQAVAYKTQNWELLDMCHDLESKVLACPARENEVLH